MSKLPNYLTDPTPEQEALAAREGAGVGKTLKRWPDAYAMGPRKLSKMPATNADAIRDAYHRVPFEFHGTLTGRLTRSQPEFQDPFHERPKARVDSPLVAVDYATIEARILAHMKEKK